MIEHDSEVFGFVRPRYVLTEERDVAFRLSKAAGQHLNGVLLFVYRYAPLGEPIGELDCSKLRNGVWAVLPGEQGTRVY